MKTAKKSELINPYYKVLGNLEAALGDMKAYSKLNKEAEVFFYPTIKQIEETLRKVTA